MTWLAKVQIDYETAARLKLNDSYAWHQAMWKAFPNRADEKRTFLFRVDIRTDGPEVLLLSPTMPERPVWVSEDGWAVKEIRSEFFGHRFFRFDVRANATRCVKKYSSDGSRQKNGRRIVISTESEQREWLNRKGEQHGFTVLHDPPLIIDPRSDHGFRKANGNTTGLHVGVRFRGALKVTDMLRFKESFHTGIGSAKAFGFGMLLLQPFQPINE